MDREKYRRHCALFYEFLKGGRGGIYIGDNTVLCGNVGGQQVLSDVRHTRSLKISFCPSPAEMGVMAVLYYFVKGGMVGAEIDAGCGYYSIFSSSLIGPSGKIYSFEPIPECFKLLVKNTQMNEIHTITCVNKAILNSMQKVKLSYFDVDYQFSFSPAQGYTPKESEAEAISLDEYMQDSGEPFLDFIIINNEDHLPQIWHGMYETLQNSTNIKIICKFSHESFDQSHQNAAEFIDTIFSNNFNIYLIPSLEKINKEDLLAKKSMKTLLLSRSEL